MRRGETRQEPPPNDGRTPTPTYRRWIKNLPLLPSPPRGRGVGGEGAEADSAAELVPSRPEHRSAHRWPSAPQTPGREHFVLGSQVSGLTPQARLSPLPSPLSRAAPVPLGLLCLGRGLNQAVGLGWSGEDVTVGLKETSLQDRGVVPPHSRRPGIGSISHSPDLGRILLHRDALKPMAGGTGPQILPSREWPANVSPSAPDRHPHIQLNCGHRIRSGSNIVVKCPPELSPWRSRQLPYLLLADRASISRIVLQVDF